MPQLWDSRPRSAKQQTRSRRNFTQRIIMEWAWDRRRWDWKSHPRATAMNYDTVTHGMLDHGNDLIGVNSALSLSLSVYIREWVVNKSSSVRIDSTSVRNRRLATSLMPSSALLFKLKQSMLASNISLLSIGVLREYIRNIRKRKLPVVVRYCHVFSFF